MGENVIALGGLGAQTGSAGINESVVGFGRLVVHLTTGNVIERQARQQMRREKRGCRHLGVRRKHRPHPLHNRHPRRPFGVTQGRHDRVLQRQIEQRNQPHQPQGEHRTEAGAAWRGAFKGLAQPCRPVDRGDHHTGNGENLVLLRNHILVDPIREQVDGKDWRGQQQFAGRKKRQTEQATKHQGQVEQFGGLADEEENLDRVRQQVFNNVGDAAAQVHIVTGLRADAARPQRVVIAVQVKGQFDLLRVKARTIEQRRDIGNGEVKVDQPHAKRHRAVRPRQPSQRRVHAESHHDQCRVRAGEQRQGEQQQIRPQLALLQAPERPQQRHQPRHPWLKRCGHPHKLGRWIEQIDSGKRYASPCVTQAVAGDQVHRQRRRNEEKRLYDYQRVG